MTSTYYDESYPASLWGAGAEAAPTLTTLSPSTKVIGSGAFTLTCTGTGFKQGSYVLFDGAGMVTTYVSPTSLTVAVPQTTGTPRTVEVRALVPAFPPTAPRTFTLTATARQQEETSGALGARTVAPDSPQGAQEAPEAPGGTGTAQEQPEAPQSP